MGRGFSHIEISCLLIVDKVRFVLFVIETELLCVFSWNCCREVPIELICVSDGGLNNTISICSV